MNRLARAGWLLCAAFFAVLLSSLLHVDYVGLVPPILLGVLALTALLRPALALALVVLIAPVAGVLASARWNGSVQWTEAVVCAALTGLAANAAWQPRRLTSSLSGPALVFATVIITSIVVSLGVVALKLGPAFTGALWTHLSREHFVDVRGFPAIFTGLRLLEGVLLFALAARLSLDAASLGRVVAGAVIGAAAAGYMNIARLVEAATRGDVFWPSLWDLADRLRWNVHYGDFNAAGSYFVLALLFAAALAVASRLAGRLFWTTAALIIACALWLTSSRVAVLAGILAVAAVAAQPYITAGRRQALRAGAVILAAVAVLAVIAFALPERGNQKSSLLAADVRLGMAQTGARMIASQPLFGIGLGEFHERSGEFSSPELIAKFPVAVHENAHNNFIQIAAELGLAGGLAFTWLIIAGLVRVAGPGGASHLAAAGIGAFVLTLLGGHPLLVAEPAFVFWTTFGAMAGTMAMDGPPVRARWWVTAVCLAILVSLPWRMQSMMRNADLEHVGIGVSSNWRTAPDGTRYREAKGSATLFVPTAGFKFSVNPQSSVPVRLELKLDGRVADVVSLSPSAWNDISFPARTERATSKSARLDLRVLDADGTVIWITKDQPIQ